MELFHDVPRSQGVANVIKRARQLVELRWTPVDEFPCSYSIGTPGGHLRQDAFFPKWRPRRGMVYSSVRKYERFVGYHISIETFMTALANPNSVLYTRSQHGAGKNMSSFYGNVCSCFVSYAVDLPYQVSCRDWLKVPGVEELHVTDLNELQLCDIAVSPGHIVIITDILRDAEGNIHKIVISESTPPQCVTNDYTPEEFRNYYLGRNYKLLRYDGIDRVGYTPSPYVHLDGDPETEPEKFPSLMTDFGNKANYLKDLEPVELSIFEEEWDTVQVIGPDGNIREYPVSEGKVTVASEEVGYYTACCICGEKCSHKVEWCVVDVEVRTEKEVYKAAEPIRIFFRNMLEKDSVVGYMIKSCDNFDRGRGLISAGATAAGEFVIHNVAALNKGGEYSVLIMSRNRYGQYVSKRAFFSVEGDAAEEAKTELVEM